jgi:hypothetical protein
VTAAASQFFRGILDYAGMFPPAALSLEDALAQYADHLRHPCREMLSRFVLPARRLDARPLPARISLLLDEPLPLLPPEVECVESNGLPADFGVFTYYEIPWREACEPRMAELSGRPRTGVKLRTGGINAADIPPAAAVAEWLLAAARHGLPCKFTAGLHVPVPNTDPRTGARMHGFLNVFAAAFLAYRGERSPRALERVLRDFDYASFRFTDAAFHAGPHEFTLPELEALRRRAVSFGSCSFLEPVEHLAAHRLLP